MYTSKLIFCLKIANYIINTSKWRVNYSKLYIFISCKFCFHYFPFLPAVMLFRFVFVCFNNDWYNRFRKQWYYTVFVSKSNHFHSFRIKYLILPKIRANSVKKQPLGFIIAPFIFWGAESESNISWGVLRYSQETGKFSNFRL